MSIRTKILTLGKTIQHVRNWPAVALGRLPGFSGHEHAIVARFRNGLNVVHRSEAQDWGSIREVMFEGTYEVCLNYLKQQSGRFAILDFGANIGLFSLRAAHSNLGADVHAYEPASQNITLVNMNRRANPELLSRIHVYAEAVGGFSRTASFVYNEKYPEGSKLSTAPSDAAITVMVRSAAEIIQRVTSPIGLAKIDVEGAEYEIFEHTPVVIWGRVPAISIEIHDDPAGKITKRSLFDRIESLGYRGVKEYAGADSWFFLKTSARQGSSCSLPSG